MDEGGSGRLRQVNELYNNISGQYRRYIGHVTKWVGGVFETPKTSDQAGAVYEAAPAAMQRDAVAFLNRELFQTPEWLLDQSVLKLVTPYNGVVTLYKLQEGTLNSLFSSDRMRRIIENTAVDPNAYTLNNLFDDLRTGIWSELAQSKPVSVHRRNLQKEFIKQLTNLYKVSQPPGASIDPQMSDVSSLARATLLQLKADISRAILGTSDSMTRYHLEDCLDRIDSVFEKN